MQIIFFKNYIRIDKISNKWVISYYFEYIEEKYGNNQLITQVRWSTQKKMVLF